MTVATGELALRAGPRPRSAAEKRGADSFYADPVAEEGRARVCRGTACLLSGGRQPERGEQPVYCLGYCDRAPALLDAQGRACAPGGAALEPAPPPRCAAPEPIVSRRLAGAGAAALGAARAYRALERALEAPPGAVLDALERSGERGRGGAGFPTARKWRACAEAPGPERVVIANGDEGDPGSFIDRLLLERDPHGVIEGMALCAFAVGARHGIVYVRSEYPRALASMRAAVEAATRAGVIGPSLPGRERGFEVSVVRGRGSYVCGEETAMLEALEGRRGEVRVRPPYPAERGLFGLPTVVNNVETLVNAPWIVEQGAERYAALGTSASSGTKVLCLARGFAQPGAVEVEFGISLREVVERLGGGGAGGRRIEALLVGGPMGSLVLPAEWDVPVCYGAMGERGIQLGHGGLVPLLEGGDLRALLLHWLEFAAFESCGRCAPCALGTRRALESARVGGARGELERLLRVMQSGSLCAFGQLTPAPIRRLLEVFGERALAAASAP